MPNITLGSDPEFFLRDTRTGTVHPAVGLIGGTKKKPIPIPGLKVKGFAMQEDNVMVEFNVPPVARVSQFLDNIKTALHHLDEHIHTFSQGTLERDVHPSRLFGHGHLAHPQAREFGCSPDFDAYREGEKCNPIDRTKLTSPMGEWRFAGGHIHIGYTDALKFELPHFVVAHLLDYSLAFHITGFDMNQGERAKHYGYPGRYRPTPYGIEYRSLSNLWIHSNNVAADVISRTFDLFMTLRETDPVQLQKDYAAVPWPSLRQALINQDARQWKEIRSYVQRTLPHSLFARVA